MPFPNKNRFLLLLLWPLCFVCHAQEQNAADTLILQHTTTRPFLRSLALPATLITYGVLSCNVDFLREQNRDLKKIIWDDNPHRPLRIDDYTMFAPAAAVYALNLAGVPGRHNLRDRSLLLGLSSVLANGISFGVKRSAMELRPDGSNRESFPSGHTTQAFVSAEFFYQEYKGRVHWTAIAGSYAVATGTGFLRMYNNKHWLSDVVAGAGIGIASTRFVYYVYPEISRLLFGSREVGNKLVVLPTYQNGMIGCAGVLRF